MKIAIFTAVKSPALLEVPECRFLNKTAGPTHFLKKSILISTYIIELSQIGGLRLQWMTLNVLKK